MDNPAEALRMIDDGYLREQGEQTAAGICKYFGVPFVTPVAPLFRVLVQHGAYRDRANAEAEAERLRAAGAIVTIQEMIK